MSEQLEFRPVDGDMFYDRLRHNGPRAFEEFKRAQRIWAEREN